jgi:hypothetical protein
MGYMPPPPFPNKFFFYISCYFYEKWNLLDDLRVG